MAATPHTASSPVAAMAVACCDITRPVQCSSRGGDDGDGVLGGSDAIRPVRGESAVASGDQMLIVLLDDVVWDPERSTREMVGERNQKEEQESWLPLGRKREGDFL